MHHLFLLHLGLGALVVQLCSLGPGPVQGHEFHQNASQTQAGNRLARGPGGPEPRSSWPTTSRPRSPWSIWGSGLGLVPGHALESVLGNGHGHQPVLELELRPGLLHRLLCRTPGGAPIGVWQVQVASGVAWQGRAPDSAPANANALVHWHSASLTGVALLFHLLQGSHSKAAFLHPCNPLPPGQPRICPCPSPSKVFCGISADRPIFANLSWFCGGPCNVSKTSFLRGDYCLSRAKKHLLEGKAPRSGRDC